jgi:hypothetical protein
MKRLAGALVLTAALTVAMSVSLAPDQPAAASTSAITKPSGTYSGPHRSSCDSSKIISRHDNADGTTTWVLGFHDGHTQAEVRPDASWDSATASDAFIAQLGLPARPKTNATEPDGQTSISMTRDEWVRDFAKINTPPAVMICTGFVAGMPSHGVPVHATSGMTPASVPALSR